MSAGPTLPSTSLFDSDALTSIRQEWTETHDEVLRLVRSAEQGDGVATVASIAAELGDSPYHTGGIVNCLVRLLLVRQWPDGRLTLDIGAALDDCPLVGEIS